MTTRIVKPMPGFVVPDPVSLRVVPEEGAVVPWNAYWQRRVAEGSLQIVEPKTKTARKTKTASTEDK